MSNPTLHFDDNHYPAIDRIDSSMSTPVDYLKDCTYVCGDIGPVCTRPQQDHPVCECGHYADCHVTVRVTL